MHRISSTRKGDAPPHQFNQCTYVAAGPYGPLVEWLRTVSVPLCCFGLTPSVECYVTKLQNNAPRKHHLSKPLNDLGTQILKLQRFKHLYGKYVVYIFITPPTYNQNIDRYPQKNRDNQAISYLFHFTKSSIANIFV